MEKGKSRQACTYWLTASAAFWACCVASASAPAAGHPKPHASIHSTAHTPPAAGSPATPVAGVQAPAADDTPLPPAPTGGIPDLRATLNGDYAAADAAFAGKDSDALLGPYDPSFQDIDLHGASMDLPGVETALAALFGAAKTAESATQILGISPIGRDSAQVDVKQHIVMLYIDPQSGENSRVTLDNICRDYWELTDSGWMKSRSRLVSSTRKVDGVQPVLPIIHW